MVDFLGTVPPHRLQLIWLKLREKKLDATTALGAVDEEDVPPPPPPPPRPTPSDTAPSGDSRRMTLLEQERAQGQMEERLERLDSKMAELLAAQSPT